MVIDDVLYGAGGWLLTSAVAAWFFARAAQRLRQAPPGSPELASATRAHGEERRGQHPGVLDAGALVRAVSVNEPV
jgi:hypothetical protein